MPNRCYWARYKWRCEKWLDIIKNIQKFGQIFEKKEPPKDNEKFKNEENKFEKYFKENL